jgi:hypothetical protein
MLLIAEQWLHMTYMDPGSRFYVGDPIVDAVISDVLRGLCPFIIMLLSLVWMSKNTLLLLYRFGLISPWFVTSFTALSLMSLISTVLVGYAALIGHRFVPYHAGKIHMMTRKFWGQVAQDCAPNTWERKLAEWLEEKLS